MCPKTVVNRSEGDAISLRIQSRKHHMTRIQRVNEIRRESVAMLQNNRVTETTRNVKLKQTA